jgi:23S rRNA (uracil1939-C5)-methyltransferase
MILVTRSAKLPFSNLLVKKLTSEFPQLSGIVQNINREKGNVILGNEEKILYGNPYINEEINNLKFRIHYKSFWQVNSAMLQLIIKNINGKVQPEDTVLDTFSGIGVLGLSLAAKVREVFCIEESSDAIDDGKFNCQLNNISNVTFLNGKTEDTLPEILNSPEKYTPKIPEVIILDPPRTGVQKSVLEEIIKAQLSHILYLSCSPITLRRDLNILLESGLYEIISIQPFDMFPQTWHIETLVELKYKK